MHSISISHVPNTHNLLLIYIMCSIILKMKQSFMLWYFPLVNHFNTPKVLDFELHLFILGKPLMCHSTYGEVTGQLVKVTSLLTPCGFHGSKSGDQAWRWTSFPTETSHWPPFSILEFWPKSAQFTWNNLNEKINLFSLSDKDHNAIHQSSSSPLDLLCVVWADQRHPQNSEHYSCYFFSFCLTLIGEGTNRNYVRNGSWCLRRAAGQRSSVESTYSLPLGDWWQRPSAF